MRQLNPLARSAATALSRFRSLVPASDLGRSSARGRQGVSTTALLVALTVMAPPVQAYVGPGLGLGALAVIIGILVSILIAVIAIVWYPLKRRMAARSSAPKNDGG